MPVVRAGLTPHTLRQLKTKVQWSQHYLSADKKYILGDKFGNFRTFWDTMWLPGIWFIWLHKTILT